MTQAPQSTVLVLLEHVFHETLGLRFDDAPRHVTRLDEQCSDDQTAFQNGLQVLHFLLGEFLLLEAVTNPHRDVVVEKASRPLDVLPLQCFLVGQGEPELFVGATLEVVTEDDLVDTVLGNRNTDKILDEFVGREFGSSQRLSTPRLGKHINEPTERSLYLFFEERQVISVNARGTASMVTLIQESNLL